MSRVADFVRSIPKYVKTHWRTANPGEYLTLREMVFYTIGSMGINSVQQLFYLVSFSAGYLCGSIFGIAVKDFYVIGIVGNILGYLFFVMRPIDILIFENHGRISEKPAKFGFAFQFTALMIGLALYFVPSVPFEHIMKGLPQIIANLLVTGALGFFLNWFIRYKYSGKHGRLKPFMVIYAGPSVLLLSLIPFLPVQNMSYTHKLVVLHLAFSFLSLFSGSYLNYSGLVQYMSPNTVERQKLHSYCALPIGLLSSLYSMLLPILVIPTGGYLNIKSYRVFIPVLGALGLALSYFLIPVKERIIEDKRDSPKVEFLKAAKKVCKNKYFWIMNLSSIFGAWTTIGNEVMNLFFIYALRQEWALGLASAFVSLLTSNISKIMVPYLIKKYEKRSIMLVSRLIGAFFFGCYFIAIKMQSIVFLILFNMGRNFFNMIFFQVNMGVNADIMDYHQWKTGERADASSGVISWFTGPVTMAIGYIFPAALARFGFTSDWDILYDTQEFKTIMILYVVFTVAGIILTLLPLLFYDLTKEKHDMCIREMEARLAEKIARRDGSAALEGAVKETCVRQEETIQ